MQKLDSTFRITNNNSENNKAEIGVILEINYEMKNELRVSHKGEGFK